MHLHFGDRIGLRRQVIFFDEPPSFSPSRRNSAAMRTIIALHQLRTACHDAPARLFDSGIGAPIGPRKPAIDLAMLAIAQMIGIRRVARARLRQKRRASRDGLCFERRGWRTRVDFGWQNAAQ